MEPVVLQEEGDEPFAFIAVCSLSHLSVSMQRPLSLVTPKQMPKENCFSVQKPFHSNSFPAATKPLLNYAALLPIIFNFPPESFLSHPSLQMLLFSPSALDLLSTLRALLV